MKINWRRKKNMTDFDIKIWLKKWGWGFLAVGVSSGLIWTAEYIDVNTLPPEYAFWGGLISVVALQIGNMIKHTFFATG